MADLRQLLETCVDDGAVPGAVALVATGVSVEVEAVGSADTEGTPMANLLLTILNKAEGNIELTVRSDGTLTGPMGTLKTTK